MFKKFKNSFQFWIRVSTSLTVGCIYMPHDDFGVNDGPHVIQMEVNNSYRLVVNHWLYIHKHNTKYKQLCLHCDVRTTIKSHNDVFLSTSLVNRGMNVLLKSCSSLSIFSKPCSLQVFFPGIYRTLCKICIRFVATGSDQTGQSMLV